VEFYVERLGLPEIRARIVYQRVLAGLAEEGLLPRLPDDDEDTAPGTETPAAATPPDAQGAAGGS
jgi:hypothetical protein